MQFGAGNSVVELDACGNAVVEQIVDIQDAGVYTFSIDHAARTSTPDGSSAFEVRVNGETILSLANEETEFSTTEVGLNLDSGESVIELVGTGASDGRGALIDNVSLRETAPEQDLATGLPAVPMEEFAQEQEEDDEELELLS